MNSERADGEALFSQLTDDLCRDPGVTRSTMMGFPCLRFNGIFFACVDRATGNLVVKLSADRVNQLVSTTTGLRFAPNGRVFKECPTVPGLSPTALTTAIPPAMRSARVADGATHLQIWEARASSMTPLGRGTAGMASGGPAGT